MSRLPPSLILLAGLLAAYLIAPFAGGAMQAGAADWSGADLPGIAAATAISLVSATLATALVAIGGVPLAFLLARIPGRFTAALGFVVQLPLALPPLVSGVLLLFLFGYATPLGRLTDGALTDSFLGIVLAEAFVAAPFLIVAARSAFASIDPALEDVARTLGHPRAAVFLRVSLPIAWRAILAGLLLAWLRAFGEFGATVMVAYHPYSLPVFTYVAFGSRGLPAMLPVLLPTILAAGLVLALSQLRLRRPPNRAVDAMEPAPFASAPAHGERPGRPIDFAFLRHLDGFTLDVAWRSDARRLAILGASGSGKSATLRLIAGLDTAQSAALHVAGAELARLPPERRAIAYVPQSYGLLPHLTVARQVRFAIGCDPAQATHWTNRLGLAALQHRRPGALSLGQQQRVAVARALCRPAAVLLLLDEPFSALDAPLRAQLRGELLALQQEIDATTILVTHDPAEALLLADAVLLLEAGHVLQSGPIESVFSRPVNEAAARLLGAQTVGAGQAVAPDRIDIGGVTLVVGGAPLGLGPVGWSARPEHIRLVSEGGYAGTVRDVAEARGGERAITVQLGSAVLVARCEASLQVAAGQCRVAIDPLALQVWPA